MTIGELMRILQDLKKNREIIFCMSGEMMTLENLTVYEEHDGKRVLALVNGYTRWIGDLGANNDQ